MEVWRVTLGQKIRQARDSCGLSQQQLADKLAVSRSAVAKWETDKGLPDVGNLKILARLLNVSVDHLLDEAETTKATVIREPYCLAAYGRGCRKIKKDRMVREKFPNSTIYTLLARQERTGLEAQGGITQDCCTSAEETTRQADKAFYLVEKEEKQLLVTVTDTFVEVRRLEQTLKDSHFQMDGWHFIKCNYALAE